MLSLVVFAALGAWIGFANPLLHFPLAALLFPLCLSWIGLRAASAKKAFKYGWIAALLAGVGIVYWVVIPVQIYGALPWYIALPCPVLLAGILGLYYAGYSLLMYKAGRRLQGVSLCLVAGVLWAAMELAMGTMFSGFPWMNLGSAFVPWVYAIQPASLVGAYGLSGILTSLAVALLLYSTYRSTPLLAVSLILFIGGYGVYRVDFSKQPEPDVMVSIIQGNVDQAQKWEQKFQAETVNTYIQLTQEAIQKNHSKIVVWPETAMPFYLQDRTPFNDSIQGLAKDSGVHIVTGSPAYNVIDLKTRAYNLLNRAWLIDETGRMTQSYDKEHLVPFGEYMPLQEWVPFEKLVKAVGNFVPGKNNSPLISDGIALGVLICYEGVFPELAQKQVEKGASALLNISNDAWFGDTSAPRQHLNLSAMRAVEQGRWLIRCTNNGISAFITPIGSVQSTTAQFKAETLSSQVAPIKDKTIYHQYFTRIKTSIIILAVLSIGFLLFPRRKKDT
ncbi:MAG: apolipoprotein N-acyltransferase [Desulfovibrio sp.]|nr:apolipoprotein N-acyltransferase [Desulfovibrio sp.]